MRKCLFCTAAIVAFSLPVDEAPAQTSGMIYACVNVSNYFFRATGQLGDCAAGEIAVGWNVVGPPGPQGQIGATGQQGTQGVAGQSGPQGAPGPASTVPGPAGQNGQNGAAGSQWHLSNGTPIATAGVNIGDLDLDTASDNIFVFQANPTPNQPPIWVQVGNIQGQVGPAGPASTVPGPVGPQGIQGPPGASIVGPTGPAGVAGAAGQNGAPGIAATITIGSVSALTPGSQPTVTNSGTSSAAVLGFGIPAGATGATGAASTVPGPAGPPGAASTVPGPPGPSVLVGTAEYTCNNGFNLAVATSPLSFNVQGASGDPGISPLPSENGAVVQPATQIMLDPGIFLIEIFYQAWSGAGTPNAMPVLDGSPIPTFPTPTLGPGSLFPGAGFALIQVPAGGPLALTFPAGEASGNGGLGEGGCNLVILQLQ